MGTSRAGRPRKSATKSKPVVLLTGGNPQIAKADGDAPVQAYLAAMPGWRPGLVPEMNQDGATFQSHRVLPYPAERVFEAFARPELLARWWGPRGFTNTFEVFEFRPGGRWKFAMHGPDGSNHPNESIFLRLDAPSTVVIQHVSPPRFVLTVTLAAHGSGTAITWAQEFEQGSVAARLRHIAAPANEQNLDRLQAVLDAESHTTALDWGTGWASVPPGSALQRELDRELAARHPLSIAKPVVIGRCLACDDVVVRLTHPADGPELAVVHLTWSRRAEKVTTEGPAWPYFERLTVDSFVARFVHGGEHA